MLKNKNKPIAILPDIFLAMDMGGELHYLKIVCLKIAGMSHLFQNVFHGKKASSGGFPGGAAVRNVPANAGDMGSSPRLGRSHMPWSS